MDAFPLTNIRYQSVGALFRIGADDVQHLLLNSCNGIFYDNCALVYERRAVDGKLATSVLSNHIVKGGTLAIGSHGNVFAAWVINEKGLIGRWVSLRPAATGTPP